METNKIFEGLRIDACGKVKLGSDGQIVAVAEDPSELARSTAVDYEFAADLSRKSLTEIPEDVQLNCKNIRQLDLSWNPGIRLNNVLRGFENLSKLVLRKCALLEIPDGIAVLTKLEELVLSSNNFTDGISPTIGQLCRLKKLDLGSCKLTNIPDSIGELGQLEELALSCNDFYEGLNPAIGRLCRLKKLDLGCCNIATLPDSIGELEQLEELVLWSNNFFDGINPAIGRLRRLKKLDLRLCNIATLPDSFQELEQLTVLNLKENCLTEYPSCTLHLKNLQCLDLSDPKKEQTEEQDTGSKWELFWNSLAQRLKVTTKRREPKNMQNETCSTLPKSSHGISSLPMELLETNLTQLILDGNPITEPPAAIWGQGLNAIKSYLREKAFGTDEVCPDTINIIGDVFAGKTSIAQSLVKGLPHPAAVDDRTRVMQQLRGRFGENGKLSVNINDFGGHQIYHSVIPIFLPSDGLTILAYNMSMPVKDQERTVKRWLLTAIAKSKDIRVIVAGTRCDAILKTKREYFENHMRKFTSSLLDGMKHELLHHINRLQLRPLNSDKKKQNHLRDQLQRIENADISVVSLSCRKPDSGLGLLRDYVSKKLRPSDIMPLRWFRVMKSILNASYSRPYLTWGEVQKLYRDHVPDADEDKDILVILRYLVRTSQVFWLEHHDKLKEFIFHLPQRILKICKDVLDHDQARQLASPWAEVYDKHIQRYSKGIVQQPFMMVLLSDEESASVSLEFLKNFNLISEIVAYDGNITYVIPSNLPAEEPKILKDLEHRLHLCPNSIAINLFFFGSMLPVSFFETSVSSMLTTAARLSNQGVATVQWRDGTIILYDAVCFFAMRCDNVFTLAAFSEHSTGNPWSILLPIVKAIHQDITVLWHGAAPESSLLCPACRFNRRVKRPVGEIDITLETLATEVQHKREKAMCPQCAYTIPACLCFPVLRDSMTACEKSEFKGFLTKYGMSVDDGIDKPTATTSTSSSTTDYSVENAEHSELEKRLRRATPKLVSELDHQSILAVVDALLAARDGAGLITERHRQDIQAERTDVDKARKLLRIVCSRGEEAIYELAMALQSDYVGRADLAKLIIE